MGKEKTIIEEMDAVIREALEHKPKGDSALGILAMALKIEELTKDYYLDLAKTVTDKTGNVMFRYLAIEETGHIKELTVQQEAIRKDSKWLLKEIGLAKGACPIKLPEEREVKTIKEIVPKGLKICKDMTDLEALKLAIEVKKRAIKFYCTAASKIDDPNGRKMFAHLIDIENKHLNELEVQYAWLDQTGFWYDPSMMTD